MSTRTMTLRYRGDALYARLCEIAQEMLAKLAGPDTPLVADPEQRSRKHVEIDRSTVPFTEHCSRAYASGALRARASYDASHWNADEVANCSVSLTIEGYLDIHGSAQGGMIESLIIKVEPAAGDKLDKLINRIPIII